MALLHNRVLIELNRHTTRIKIRGSVVSYESFIFFIRRRIKKNKKKQVSLHGWVFAMHTAQLYDARTEGPDVSEPQTPVLIPCNFVPKTGFQL